jgi:hypothetical protein
MRQLCTAWCSHACGRHKPKAHALHKSSPNMALSILLCIPAVVMLQSRGCLCWSLQGCPTRPLWQLRNLKQKQLCMHRKQAAVGHTQHRVGQGAGRTGVIPSCVLPSAPCCTFQATRHTQAGACNNLPGSPPRSPRLGPLSAVTAPLALLAPCAPGSTTPHQHVGTPAAAHFPGVCRTAPPPLSALPVLPGQERQAAVGDAHSPPAHSAAAQTALGSERDFEFDFAVD